MHIEFTRIRDTFMVVRVTAAGTRRTEPPAVAILSLQNEAQVQEQELQGQRSLIGPAQVAIHNALRAGESSDDARTAFELIQTAIFEKQVALADIKGAIANILQVASTENAQSMIKAAADSISDELSSYKLPELEISQ